MHSEQVVLLWGADLMGVRDEPSVAASVGYVKELVAAEVAAGTPESRIVLAGFSQGGHITLRTSARTLCRPQAPARVCT